MVQPQSNELNGIGELPKARDGRRREEKFTLSKLVIRKYHHL
jgi:hypothetical protein